MAATHVNDGENKIANLVFKQAADELFTLRLYTAVSGGVLETTGNGDLTEATFGGYAGIGLTTGNWTVTASDAAAAEQTFTHDGGATSPQTVLGWYLNGTTSAVLYWVEAFPSSITVDSNGDQIKVTVTVSVD
jgi:hypothetical protein